MLLEISFFFPVVLPTLPDCCGGEWCVGKDQKARSMDHKMTRKPHGGTRNMKWNSVLWLAIIEVSAKFQKEKNSRWWKICVFGFVLFCLLIYIEVMSEAFFLRMIRNLRFLSAKQHYARSLQNCSIYLCNNPIFRSQIGRILEWVDRVQFILIFVA